MAPWIQFILSAMPPQLYLQEYHSSYGFLDNTRNLSPRVIHVIGNNHKNRLLRYFNIDPVQNEAGVHLYQIHLQKNPILIFDSPWPRNQFKKIESVSTEHSKLHLFQNQHRPNAFNSHVSLFAQILGTVSQTVVLFMDDLPSLFAVIEFLGSWVRYSHLDSRSRPRLLLVSERFDMKANSRAWFFDKLLRHITITQHTVDPTQVHIKSDSEIKIWRCFEAIEFLPDDNQTTKLILQHSKDIFDKRNILRWTFRAFDIRQIVQSAITHSVARRTEHFNTVVAMRDCDRGKDFKLQIEELVNVTPSNEHENLARVVASALHADAYPKQGHKFLAAYVYKDIYYLELISLLSKFRLEFIEKKIESAFYTIASESQQDMLIPSFERHLSFLKKSKHYFETKFSKVACFVCLMRSSCMELLCGHTLCERCVRLIGIKAGNHQYHFEISCCPLCQSAIMGEIYLRPPTAARRVLELDGLLQDKVLLGHFLRDLQSSISLTSIPLSSHFDAAYAKGVGAYYALAMYLRGWSISQCIDGLEEVTTVQFKRGFFKQKDRIAFGVNQKYTIDEIKSYTGTSINIQHRGRSFSNKYTISDSDWASCDVTISCDSKLCDSVLLQTATEKLIGSFFYLELVDVPFFCHSSLPCRVQLMCCIPSGPARESLQRRLLGSRIKYKGDEKSYMSRQLHTDFMDNQPSTALLLEIQIASFDSTIDVCLEQGSSEFAVSRCPYMVRDMVKDQGVQNYWDPNFRATRQDSFNVGQRCQSMSREYLEEELAALQRAMRRVVSSTAPGVRAKARSKM
ncbi:hypothetical protein F4678DRAFT_416905 [Xylaria arbuscula]|nr:hypothetical protein F4678DRAFT_416905 [Xylaria arbuscula]